MRITVLGATGRTGGHVLRQSLDRGLDVTAVVRDPARLALRASGLTVVRIPALHDVWAVREVLSGADAVLSTIGPRGRKDAPVAAPVTEAILQALGADPVRLVVISAAPVGPPTPGDGFLNRRIAMPLIGAILRPVYEDLAAMEHALGRSPAAWTAMRPPRLTDGPLTGRYRMAVGGAVPRGLHLSRADLAHAMLAVLDRPDTVRQPVGVAH